MASPGANTGSSCSPPVNLIDDDEAVSDALSLRIGTADLRTQPRAKPQDFTSVPAKNTTAAWGVTLPPALV